MARRFNGNTKIIFTVLKSTLQIQKGLASALNYTVIKLFQL